MINCERIVTRTVIVAFAGAGCTPAFWSDESRALMYASMWLHGVSSAPDSIREYMAGNRSGTDAIEEALLDRRRRPREFSEVSAVYWLSNSGRPEYLKTLMRFAGDTNGDVATYSIFGLVRHTHVPAVRARLMQLDVLAARDVRNNMASMLAIVNDSGARRVLATMSRRDLNTATIRWIEVALSDPPQAWAHGRWPCRPNELDPETGRCTRRESPRP